jgi:hypothetical protein
LIDSAIESNASALEKMVRVCAGIVAGLAVDMGVDLRPLRRSRAANSGQVERESDGAKAWRVTLTDRGPGWRMHYWHVPSRPSENQTEAIEFERVLRKHDPEIIDE